MAKASLIVYLHFPFCSSKCHFCFKMHHVERRQLLDQSLHEAYCEALLHSIDAIAPQLAQSHDAVGVVWGGGTPSLIPPKYLVRLHDRLRQHWDIKGLPNSFEMTPETVETPLLETLLECGVNRISLGVQTFNDVTLRRMGRAHNSDLVHRAVESARAVGITNLNIDLITTLPGDTLDDLAQSLNQIGILEPPHLTTYFYNPTAGTVLFDQIQQGRAAGWTQAQHEDAIRLITIRLRDMGYANYEFFHWSKDPDQFSYPGLDHYFGHCGDVFGFGSGAQSFLAPNGCLEFPELPGYLDDPVTQRPGKFDLAYSLERALGSRVGLSFAHLARTFGLEPRDIANHALVDQLRFIPGIDQSETGLSLPPHRYFAEYARGVASRFDRIATGERIRSFAE